MWRSFGSIKTLARRASQVAPALPSTTAFATAPTSKAYGAALVLSLATSATAAAAFSSAAAEPSAVAKATTAAVQQAAPAMNAESVLYPAIEPYNKGMLKVSKIHSLYYEECGNPNGKVRRSSTHTAVVATKSTVSSP